MLNVPKSEYVLKDNIRVDVFDSFHLREEWIFFLPLLLGYLFEAQLILPPDEAFCTITYVIERYNDIYLKKTRLQPCSTGSYIRDFQQTIHCVLHLDQAWPTVTNCPTVFNSITAFSLQESVILSNAISAQNPRIQSSNPILRWIFFPPKKCWIDDCVPQGKWLE